MDRGDCPLYRSLKARNSTEPEAVRLVPLNFECLFHVNSAGISGAKRSIAVRSNRKKSQATRVAGAIARNIP